MYLDSARLYQPLLLSPGQGKAAYQTTFLSIWKERSFSGARVHCREFKSQHFLNILGEVKEHLLIACCMQADMLGTLLPFHGVDISVAIFIEAEMEAQRQGCPRLSQPYWLFSSVLTGQCLCCSSCSIFRILPLVM